ncbi:hypothetical protein HPQ64_15780 [Rhizobiales bacterium]|uniref:hypothetical protein n=1 Tax=Hongsoonwoonella zoysiae TaxID=2821844 RepID=UPI00155FC097|nr:hypothetical protein [Hongsoonwoonella zoysiae]NRG19151.1 hypothetical protein [Hongsoonwoonella zoysiae]
MPTTTMIPVSVNPAALAGALSFVLDVQSILDGEAAALAMACTLPAGCAAIASLAAATRLKWAI